MTPVQVKYPRDYRCLPQNLMSAMSASVPLTAVQITDANLLKMEKTHIHAPELAEESQHQYNITVA